MNLRRRATGILTITVCAVLVRQGVALEPQVVSFETSDKQTIAADYYAPKVAGSDTKAPIAILLHMYRSDRKAWTPLAPALHDAGFAVLAIDMRGHGDSATGETRKKVEDRDTAVFESMSDDVRAAYDWLAKQPGVDRARFALVGASVGCSVALRYAAKDKSVDAIVCLSPGANYLGLDSAADIREIKGRKMWLVAAEDARERAGVDALGPLGEGAEVDVFPGALHGTRMFGKVPSIEKKVAGFLASSVGRPGVDIVCGSIDENVYYPLGSPAIEKIAPRDLRYYSSAAEAESRGLSKAGPRGVSDSPEKPSKP